MRLTAALIITAFLPAQALACSIAPLPPPLANESPAEHRARAEREIEESAKRYAAERLDQQKQAEASWWSDAKAIIVYRVTSPYIAELDAHIARNDARYARWQKRVKQIGQKAAGPPPPPTRLPAPPTFDIYAKSDILLVPVEGIRSTGKPAPLKLWSRLSNTSCGPMHSGWLEGAVMDDIAIGFFRNGATFTEKNLLGIRQRSDAVDARTQAILARYPAPPKVEEPE
jgi:hypothetical protein